MKFKKHFLIFAAFSTASLYFSSCFNSVNDDIYPIPMPVAPGVENVKYATLQGRISYEGAVPSALAANTNSERTAMTDFGNTWVYVLQATATGQANPAPVVVNASATSYSYPNIPTTQAGISWTVTVRLKKAAADSDDSAIMIDSYQATLTNDNSVYVHDFMLKPHTTGSGTLLLTMTVPLDIASITAECTDTGWVTPVISLNDAGTTKIVTITTTSTPCGSYSVRFNFKDANGILLYSNKQIINVLNNCVTGTWINNGNGTGNSDPISSGNYTVTTSMLAQFQLTTFYVGTTPISESAGTVTQGYTGTPAAPFSKIDEAITAIAAKNNSNVNYTILVTGSVLGNHTIGSTLNGKAAGITIRGAQGLDTNNLPKDELRLRADDDTTITGTTLSVRTSVPVIIENLRITKGYTESDYAGGIYIDSGATVKLAGGALVTGNSGKMAGGVYNKGKLFMYGTARIGDTTEELATSSANGWANKSNNSDSEVAGGIYNVSSGTVYLGYDGFTDATPPQLHKSTLSGGITRNYKCGIYTKGTIYFDSGNIAYNYSTNWGGGVYLGSDSAKLIMTGGSIANNQAYSYGGGVYITGAGEFDLQKGTLSSNTLGSYGQKGGAVYNGSGTFKLGKEASITSSSVKNNDIALYSGQKIQVDNTLDQTSFALDLTTTTRGTQVLTGSKVADVYTKFSLYNTIYGMGINSEGKIDLDVIVTDIYINQSAAAANSFEPSTDTKNDSTWNNATYAFNASADSSQTKPFKKMDTALKFITYQASAQDYTIHIVGTYTVNSTDTQNIIANNTYTDNPIRLVKTATQTNPTVTATKITIAGVVDVDNPPKIVGGTFDGWPYSCVKIQTEVPVVFTNISIEGGRISNGGSGAGGINIDSSSAPRVSDVTLSTGTTVYDNRGYNIGAIQNYGTLKIAGATIKNNTHSNGLSGKGGAIYNAGGILYIYNNNTMIGQTEYSEPAKDETNKYSNYAITAGGAIYNENNVYNGTTYKGTIYIGKDADGNYSNPKISYNYARNGGAIYNSTGSEINFCQGEIVYNGTRATDGKGGGIYNEGILIFSDTGGKTKKIYRNSAVKGGAVYEGGSSAQLKMGTSGNNREVEIEWNDTGLSSYNNIYLDTKSGEDPCMITLTTTMSNMTALRIDTAISTFTGKQIIEASGSASLADSVKYFKPVQPNPLPDLPYLINTDGKIAQLTGRSNINAAAVGDIILDNGSIIPYSDDLDLDFKRNDAVAIVFNIDSSCSNDSSNRILAFAVNDLGRNSKKWIDLENYHNITSNPFTELVVFTAGDWLSSYFSYWKDGSGNRAYARSHYPSSGVTLTSYPPLALDWCNSFGSVDPNCSTNYSTGWYLPSVTELKKIYENKTTLNKSVKKVKTYSSYYLPYDYSYWSANAGGYEDSGYHFWAMSMSDGSFEEKHCKTGLYVLPIRQFN